MGDTASTFATPIASALASNTQRAATRIPSCASLQIEEGRWVDGWVDGWVGVYLPAVEMREGCPAKSGHATKAESFLSSVKRSSAAREHTSSLQSLKWYKYNRRRLASSSSCVVVDSPKVPIQPRDGGDECRSGRGDISSAVDQLSFRGGVCRSRRRVATHPPQSARLFRHRRRLLQPLVVS